MKEVTLVTDDLYHVLSEPGDATRYDYFVFRDGPDKFCFMPRRNSFRYPQRLSYYEIGDIMSTDDMTSSYRDSLIFELAKRELCNPHTLIECLTTMEQLRRGSI